MLGKIIGGSRLRLLTLSLSLVVAVAAALVAAPGRAWAADTYTVTIGNYENKNYILGFHIDPADVLEANGVVFEEGMIPDTIPDNISFNGETQEPLSIEYTTSTGIREEKVYRTSCTKNATPPAPSVDSVTVSPGSLELVAGGDTGTLTASVLPADADQGITWGSSDESVATVSDQGVVTPVAAATVTITATSVADTTKSGTCAVTVSEPTPAKTATLTFDLAGGTLDGKTGTYTMAAEVGKTVKLPGAPTKDGYTFKCWKGSEYAAGADYEVEGDHAFTAEWTENEKPTTATTATITFDANGGTGTMDPKTGEAGSTITLGENKFTRSGYAFAGWNTSKDGSGTSYKDKAEVKLDGNMTLYAQWTKNATATPATKSSTSGTTNSAKSSTSGTTTSAKSSTTPKTGDPASLAAAAVAAASGAASLAGGTALRRHTKRRGRHLRG